MGKKAKQILFSWYYRGRHWLHGMSAHVFEESFMKYKCYSKTPHRSPIWIALPFWEKCPQSWHVCTFSISAKTWPVEGAVAGIRIKKIPKFFDPVSFLTLVFCHYQILLWSSHSNSINRTTEKVENQKYTFFKFAYFSKNEGCDFSQHPCCFHGNH